MCRIAAYFGPPMRLSVLLRDAPHGLEHQSKAAREMGGESVAGDGWGIGWFPEMAGEGAGLFKSILPLWADLNARIATRAIASRLIVGHIRLASEGIEVCFLNTALYRFDDHLFTINEELKPWPSPLSRALRARLDAEDEAALQGSTDAEMLGALWRTCLRREPSRDPVLALQAALGEARELARKYDGSIRVSVIIAGREGFAAARYGEPVPPPSLYFLTGADRWRGGSVVASEPLDDERDWQPVDPGFLVTANRAGLRMQPLRLSP